MHPVATTDLPFGKTSGKVRDVYRVGHGQLLLVATDRVSAFDVVLPTPIPGKGALLTQVSLLWFRHFSDVPNHLVTADVGAMPAAVREHADVLRGRSMLVRELAIVPFECVARGYLAGGGWREYRETGRICGVALPPGLVEGDRLPAPIFTPATKATKGHDENVPFEAMADALGGELATALRDRTLDLFRRASRRAEAAGLILADTKLEWGLDDRGQPVLADEIFTPDSSRYWPADAWSPGANQPSFDKQFVREHLAALDWDRKPPGPALPEEVVAGTRGRYEEAYERLRRVLA